LTCLDGRSIRSCFEQSYLRPDESTTNIGLFKAGIGSLLEDIDQPLLILGEPSESLSAKHATAWGEFA
jgi:hypothetical protein